MGTHNLCFRAKIRKKIYPRKPQFYYIKKGVQGGINHMDMLSRWCALIGACAVNRANMVFDFSVTGVHN